eukprot:g6027.t1
MRVLNFGQQMKLQRASVGVCNSNGVHSATSTTLESPVDSLASQTQTQKNQEAGGAGGVLPPPLPPFCASGPIGVEEVVFPGVVAFDDQRPVILGCSDFANNGRSVQQHLNLNMHSLLDPFALDVGLRMAEVAGPLSLGLLGSSCSGVTPPPLPGSLPEGAGSPNRPLGPGVRGKLSEADPA